MHKYSYCMAAFATAAMLTVSVSTGESEARRAFARGANGTAGAYAASGTYGYRKGGRVLTPNAGAGISQSSWNGPNGGAFNRAGGFGYKKGVGAARTNQWSGTTPAGGTGAGYANSKYNAQTGAGTRESGASYTNPSGQSYGYDGSTSYVRGQGGTTSIDTQNKGTYSVDWQQGQKPVVTTTPQ